MSHMFFDRASDGASILFFGDPHGSFRNVVEVVQRHRPHAIILLGDLTPALPLHIELQEILGMSEVWFVPGNHDSDEVSWWENISTHLVGTPLEERNLHGRVVTIAGYRVAGLGGIFRGAIWRPKAEARVTEKFSSPEALLKCVFQRSWTPFSG